MGMSPTMASMLNYGDVLKALRIYMAAFLCIFSNIFKWYDKRA